MKMVLALICAAVFAPLVAAPKGRMTFEYTPANWSSALWYVGCAVLGLAAAIYSLITND